MERSTMKITPIFIVLFFVVLFASEVKGQALDFDGIDDYASASGGLANNSNFTLEAWVKPRSFSSYNWVIQVGDVALGLSENGKLTYMVAATDWEESEAYTTWLGTNSSDWITAANWSDGVPTTTEPTILFWKITQLEQLKLISVNNRL